MKFDIQHATADPNWTPDILSSSALTRFARAVEDSGYASLGFTDHPAPPARWVRAGGEGSIDPFSALGFCAAVTSKIRLLTFVLVLPYRNPFLAAHQTASLDSLSDGRLIVGLGTGYLRGEFGALGVHFDSRCAAFDEAVGILRRSWAGEEISFSSGTLDARGVVLQPLPVQRPGPPLWVHGNAGWGLERAARYGDGWFGVLATGQLARMMRTAPIDGFGELAKRIDTLRRSTVAHGRDAHAVEVVLSGHWPMLDVRRGWDSSRMRDEVAELTEMGVDRVVVIVCGDDPGASEDTVRRFGEEVIALCG
ncbi:LLM class F420-dependent oxidoreductase [Mycobacterium sp. E796]|nr:LLM class F420-dependent oxidoreductase [Mycobacterium sp. E796]